MSAAVATTSSLTPQAAVSAVAVYAATIPLLFPIPFSQLSPLDVPGVAAVDAETVRKA